MAALKPIEARMSSALDCLTDSIDVGVAVAPMPRNRISQHIAANRATSFGYDATEDKHRRKAPYALLRSEDDELPVYKRQQVITLGRDIRRNFSIAAWAIRRHLDYVARFRFRSLTGLKPLDERITELMRWASRAENFDASKRHGLRKYLRLAEASRTVDGDIVSILRNNGRLQAIEADRIKTPITYLGGVSLPTDVLRRMRYGVMLDDDGAALAYAVNRRGPWYTVGPDLQAAPNSFTFERLVPARNCIHLGYFDRFDQVRGISPVLAALNSFRDVYEGFDYALAQAKVAQLFALAIKRNSLKSLQEHEGSEAGPADYAKQLDFNRGPVLLDLDPGDVAEFLQSNNPSSNWQAFINVVIAVALKSLDIPFSFFDESHTNYSGSRGAWLMYDQSAEDKAEDLRDTFLDRWTAWRLGILIYRGVLVLPSRFDPKMLKWGWIRKRVPWIDPLKEIQAARQEVNGGFTSTPATAESMGNDAYEMADQEAAYQNYRETIGLPRTDIPLAPVPVTINQAKDD
jgi:capsid protein